MFKLIGFIFGLITFPFRLIYAIVKLLNAIVMIAVVLSFVLVGTFIYQNYQETEFIAEIKETAIEYYDQNEELKEYYEESIKGSLEGFLQDNNLFFGEESEEDETNNEESEN
ncbi:hypothetical protein MWH28_09300 [Natroniella sulfidigena]|uniref:hypothetical protein n=1 Tax=Natroniella sulfidigena TaxID=723921 RepID=UPI00200AE3D5|nr:hypothetical protein [Natroniella sulfidigena]MCK8817551.1 hypothetical protein [Natroniella sulfidigena]